MGYGDGFLYRRGEIWWISLNTPQGRVRESTGTSDHAKAEQQLLRRRSEQHKNSIRFSMASEYLLADYRANRRRSLPDVKRHLEIRLLPAFGDLLVNDLSFQKIEAYKRDRLLEGASPATVNRELSALRKAHEIVRRRFPELSLRPLEFERLVEDNVRTGFVSHRQFERFREQLPEYVRRVVVCLYYWGCRRAELVGDCRSERRKDPLRWTNVHLEGKSPAVFLTRTKNDTPREVPIYNKELMEVFESAWAENESRDTQSPYVFTRRGKPFYEFRKSWSRAARAAGLSGLRPHDFRRTAIRNMVRAGIPAAIAMLVTGHKTRSAFERYNITDSFELEIVGTRMAAYLGTEKPREAQTNRKTHSEGDG